ncbi:putative acetyltransferase [Mucilaginibacter paludis DSM 18603]|uniref:Acetyltransferase n=2 Tax=Mucilaginibacter TaxID=423349 RepID=H1Y0J6_9SPHI|nr:putative acetyltransferase [Mucilaginibacter paludis DSM 18603]
MFSSHNINDPDPYVRSVFSFRDKIKRFVWNIVWIVLCRWTPNPLHKWRVLILRLFGGKIGSNNFIYPDCKIWAPWLLDTGDVVTIGPGVEVYNPGGVSIGHHTILSQDAYICGATHNYNEMAFTYLKRQIVFEPYVWICAKAVVLPGVRCQEGSVLGAAAVIGKNMEAWTVYAGNPAVAVKKRNNFLLEK